MASWNVNKCFYFTWYFMKQAIQRAINNIKANNKKANKIYKVFILCFLYIKICWNTFLWNSFCYSFCCFYNFITYTWIVINSTWTFTIFLSTFNWIPNIISSPHIFLKFFLFYFYSKFELYSFLFAIKLKTFISKFSGFFGYTIW